MNKIFYGWQVVGGAFALMFCAMGTQFYAFPVFFDAILRDTGWSRVQTAATLSIGMLASGAAGPVIGMLIPKIGVRAIMTFGSVVAGIGLVLLSTVSELWQLYVFFGLIFSVGAAAMSFVPSVAAIESWFIQKRSTALGIATAGIGAGGTVIAPLASLLISIYDWQTAFLFLAAMVTVIGVPVSSIIMRTSSEKKPASTDQQEGSAISTVTQVEGLTLTRAVKERAFWLISVGVMLWAWAYSVGLVHQVAFAVDMGIERVAAATAVSLVTAFGILGRLGFGRLGDMIEKRYVFVMATSLQIVAFIVLMRATNLIMLYIYSFLIGLNIGGMTPILPGLISDYFGTKYFGVIFGLSQFILILGVVIGPVFAGWIFDTSGSYFIAFLTSIILSFTAMIAIYFARRPCQIPLMADSL